LKSALRQSTLVPKSAAKAEPAPKEKVGDEQEEDVEMESSQSTPPETRSPVIFNRHPPSLMAVPALELSKSANEVEDEAEAQSEDEASSSDEESNESSEDQDGDEDEDDDDDDDDEDEDVGEAESKTQELPTVQVLNSSLKRPGAQPISQPSLSGKPNKHTSQLSPSSSDKESTTQAAIDYQLTSSIYEARASSQSQKAQSQNKSKTSSNASTPQRPKFKIGASLRDLNAAKDVGESGRVGTQIMVNPDQGLKSIGSEGSESESESESEEETGSESDNEEVASKAFEAQLSQAQSVPLPSSDEDSNSDDGSERKYMDTMRNKLVADLARLARKTSSVGHEETSGSNMSESSREKSHKSKSRKDKSRIAGRDIVKAEKKKRENKYLTGYTFSQVK
jgi:hypothetical protein